MKDEEFVYREEVRDKANVARSAHHKRSHTGKGGRVKFPSDYMTKKEKEAMNGEVKSYRLNEPMTWKEFKAMPDDIKVTYIKLLRERFNCFDSAIAEMMGVSKVTLSTEIKRIGLGHGTKHGGHRAWDEKEAFYAWCSGVSVKLDAVGESNEEQPVVEEVAVETPVEEIPFMPVTKDFFEEIVLEKKAIPESGTMVFEGKVEKILKSIGNLLGGANVHISVTWDVLEDD